MVSLVGFAGSRAFPVASERWTAALVGSVFASGLGVGVGCCVGADSAVLSGALVAAPPAVPVSVFAAFGPGGVGAWDGSAVSLVSAAEAAGASVRWWAGGPVSVPLGVRLAARSVALVRAVAASGPGAWFVAFVGVSCPAGVVPAARWVSGAGVSGSWSAAALAAGLGLPLLVVPVASGLVAPASWGSWSRASLAGRPVWVLGASPVWWSRWDEPPLCPR